MVIPLVRNQGGGVSVSYHTGVMLEKWPTSSSDRLASSTMRSSASSVVSTGADLAGYVSAKAIVIATVINNCEVHVMEEFLGGIL